MFPIDQVTKAVRLADAVELIAYAILIHSFETPQILDSSSIDQPSVPVT
jgi:hypothetical protein